MSGTRKPSPKASRLDLLRDRLLKARCGDCTDSDLLELLLTTALHRHDVLEIVNDLLREFGSLDAILSASPRELRRVRGIGEAVAVLIRVVDRIRTTTWK